MNSAMHNTKRIVYGILIVLMILALDDAQLSAESPADLESFVDGLASTTIESGNAIGISIAVAQGDDTLLAKGYGLADVESNTPATAQTVYRIGSITKQFTAAGILQLVEQEKLTLDDPITDYMADYPTQGHNVTIRHLLQHTSGIKSFTDLPTYRERMTIDVDHDNIINRVKQEPFHFAPGEKYRYCNSGYYFLGVILEDATDQKYDELLKERIFTPLELSQTYYDRPATIIPHRANGYSNWGGKLRNARYLSMTLPFSAGALASTVEDLVAWQRALVNNKLLSTDSYELMTTTAQLADGKPAAYGLGTFIRKHNGRLTFGHGGGINGFRSQLVYYPESDYTIVVLANCEQTNPSKLAQQIADQVIPAEPQPDSK